MSSTSERRNSRRGTKPLSVTNENQSRTGWRHFWIFSFLFHNRTEANPTSAITNNSSDIPLQQLQGSPSITLKNSSASREIERPFISLRSNSHLSSGSTKISPAGFIPPTVPIALLTAENLVGPPTTPLSSTRLTTGRVNPRARTIRSGSGRNRVDRGGRLRRFWDWQPSLATRESCMWKLCRETKIPGLKDATKEGTHVSARIFWFAAFFVMLSIGIQWTIDTIGDFRRNAAQLEKQVKKLPTREVPFFSMTCGKGNNLHESTIDEILNLKYDFDNSKNGIVVIDGIDWNYLDYQKLVAVASEICEPKSKLGKYGVGKSKSAADLGIKDNGIKDDANDLAYTEKIIPFLKKRERKCSDRVAACSFNGIVFPCELFFNDIVIDIGGACVFNQNPTWILRTVESIATLFANRNMSDREEKAWKDLNLDDVLYLQAHISKFIDSIPYTQHKAGMNHGLEFLLIFDEDESQDFCIQGAVPGIPIGIHPSSEDPELMDSTTLATKNNIYTFAVIPKVTRADADTASLPFESRGCYLKNEGQLKYYSKYTQKSCLREKAADYVYDRCNCTTLDAPKPPGRRLCLSNEEKICAANKEAYFYYNGTLDTTCPPECSKVEYETVVTVTPFDPKSPPDIVEQHLRKYNSTKYAAWIKLFIARDSIEQETVKPRFSSNEQLGILGGIFGTTNNFTAMDLFRFIYYAIGLIIPVRIIISVSKALWKILRKRCCCKKPKNSSDTLPLPDATQLDVIHRPSSSRPRPATVSVISQPFPMSPSLRPISAPFIPMPAPLSTLPSTDLLTSPKITGPTTPQQTLISPTAPPDAPDTSQMSPQTFIDANNDAIDIFTINNETVVVPFTTPPATPLYTDIPLIDEQDDGTEEIFVPEDIPSEQVPTRQLFISTAAAESDSENSIITEMLHDGVTFESSELSIAIPAEIITASTGANLSTVSPLSLSMIRVLPPNTIVERIDGGTAPVPRNWLCPCLAQAEPRVQIPSRNIGWFQRLLTWMRGRSEQSNEFASTLAIASISCSSHDYLFTQSAAVQPTSAPTISHFESFRRMLRQIARTEDRENANRRPQGIEAMPNEVLC